MEDLDHDLGRVDGRRRLARRARDLTREFSDALGIADIEAVPFGMRSSVKRAVHLTIAVERAEQQTLDDGVPVDLDALQRAVRALDRLCDKIGIRARGDLPRHMISAHNRLPRCGSTDPSGRNPSMSALEKYLLDGAASYEAAGGDDGAMARIQAAWVTYCREHNVAVPAHDDVVSSPVRRHVDAEPDSKPIRRVQLVEPGSPSHRIPLRKPESRPTRRRLIQE